MSRVLDRLERLPPLGRPPILGISGFGGAGKSTFARTLADEIGNAVVVGADAFWRPDRDVRCADWGAIDRDRLREEVLMPALGGRPVRYRPADFVTGVLGEAVPVQTGATLIVEGIGLFHPGLNGLFDLTVWLDTPFEVALARGMERDRKEYGVDHDARWTEVWGPNDLDYFAAYEPRARADLIVAG
ncbi:MAG: hypothetical protein KIS66_09415 [Fimbriimonadaceae bacterium]|nr:hypothetical protein [Fimbriimonadaceae bacterium]